MKILVVDDDEKLTKVLAAYLVKEGYQVQTANNGLDAMDIVNKEMPDLILLDVMLPGLYGWEVCQQIRKTSNVPIIMLTAVGGEDERIKGLDIGADDYITKPFSPREVMARIRALLRRARFCADDAAEVYRIGNIELNKKSRSLSVKGRAVEVTPTEYKLLELFMSHPGQVFSRLQLIEHSQGYSYDGYERTIDSHIKNLRKKLGAMPGEPHYIKAVYGVGYKLVGDEHA